MALFQKAVYPYGQNLLPSISPSAFQKHRWFDAPKQDCFVRWRMTLIVSPNGLYFHASKHFLRVCVNYFFQMKNISMLEQNSYLISKYSLNLQHLTLICMYLTPGLTEFILIRIHSLPTITGIMRCVTHQQPTFIIVIRPSHCPCKCTPHWPSLDGLDFHYSSNSSF